MRAMCGAVIAAGAAIGLGLTAVGIGVRYQSFPYHVAAANADTGARHYVLMKDLDTSLMLTMVLLGATLVIGLATAFMGLAYHHHRRMHEMKSVHLTGAGRATV